MNVTINNTCTQSFSESSCFADKIKAINENKNQIIVNVLLTIIKSKYLGNNWDFYFSVIT